MPLRAYCKERSRITVSLGPSSALGEKDKKRGQNRTPEIEADYIALDQKCVSSHSWVGILVISNV